MSAGWGGVDTIRFSLPGMEPRKSNSRQIVTSSRQAAGQKVKSRLIKSKKALDYEQAAAAWILHHPELRRDLTGAIWIDAVIYYANKTSDLSDELLCDVLQDIGIVRNDNSFRKKTLEWSYDPEEPRCEVILRPLPDYPEFWLPKYRSKAELAIARLKRQNKRGVHVTA